MQRFLKETPTLSNPAVRRVVEGLTTYAHGVYELMRDKDVPAEYRGIAERLSNLLEGMDSKYYVELEGQPDDMKRLVGYLNTQRI